MLPAQRRLLRPKVISKSQGCCFILITTNTIIIRLQVLTCRGGLALHFDKHKTSQLHARGCYPPCHHVGASTKAEPKRKIGFGFYIFVSLYGLYIATQSTKASMAERPPRKRSFGVCLFKATDDHATAPAKATQGISQPHPRKYTVNIRGPTTPQE